MFLSSEHTTHTKLGGGVGSCVRATSSSPSCLLSSPLSHFSVVVVAVVSSIQKPSVLNFPKNY